MQRKAWTGVVLLSIAVSAPDLNAQTIYNDGGTHTVDGPSGPIEVLNGSTLNVDSPASVTATTSYYNGIYGDSTSAINLNGGQVLGATYGQVSGYDEVGAGIISYGSFTASGGVAQGGYGLLAYGPVNITGGSFIGGGGLVYDGLSGATIIGQLGDQVLISGGSFQGVQANSFYGIGVTLIFQGAGQASITGGDFVGRADDPSGPSSWSLSYYGASGSSTIVSGGVFSSPIVAYLQPAATLSFVGQDLQVNQGMLVGTLENGNAIDVRIDVVGSPSISETMIPGGEILTFTGGIPPAPVPEPSALLMLALGIGGASFARRRMERRPGPRGLSLAVDLLRISEASPRPCTGGGQKNEQGGEREHEGSA